jgi:hypothetical protein
MRLPRLPCKGLPLPNWEPVFRRSAIGLKWSISRPRFWGSNAWGIINMKPVAGVDLRTTSRIARWPHTGQPLLDATLIDLPQSPSMRMRYHFSNKADLLIVFLAIMALVIGVLALLDMVLSH